MARIPVKVTGKYLTRYEGEPDARGRRQRVRYNPGDTLEVSPELLAQLRDRLTPIDELELTLRETDAANTGGEADSAEQGELDELRAVAEALGVDVDQRWREKRLRAEIEKAGDDLRRRGAKVGVEIGAADMGPAEAREAVEQAEREAAEKAKADGEGGSDGDEAEE